ncbi:exosome complex component RRP46-like [Musca domestica]|uniref:Exosome complex component RRP46-like n=1 Tax=Musca domestica TaxID=7370 RepID=A0A1I8M6Y9_MUSDO|nr:exosome complex component RRP46-like [Musca domestica]
MVTNDTKGHNDANTNRDVKIRSLNCELNPLTRTDGSALFAQGGTCVMASILGPVEVKLQNLNIDKAYVECIYRPKAGLPTIRDRMRETVIKDTCEAALLSAMHPRTMVSVQVQELDDRGGLDACAINAACMALLIGGIPMKFTVAAVCCIVDKNGELILDPDYGQINDSRANFTFVFDSLERDLVTVNSTGCFKMAQFNDAYLMCRAASGVIFDFYRKIMTKFHTKTNPTPTSPKEGEEAMED